MQNLKVDHKKIYSNAKNFSTIQKITPTHTIFHPNFPTVLSIPLDTLENGQTDTNIDTHMVKTKHPFTKSASGEKKKKGVREDRRGKWENCLQYLLSPIQVLSRLNNAY